MPYMDGYSGKKSVGGPIVPRKGSNFALRDTADNRDQNAQFCSRLGCSGRLNYTKGTPIGSSLKAKSLRPSFRSSTGKEIVGSSSRTCSVVSNAKKSFQESRRKLSSKLETDSSETSSTQDDEVVERIASPRRIQTGFQSELRDAESSKTTLMEVRSPSVASRPRKIFRQKSGLGNQDTVLGSPGSSTSESTGQEARYGANASRYGLRNLRCNSISDVLPQGSSSSESNISRRRDMVKKRNPEGESSSTIRGKNMSGPSSDNRRITLSNGGISLSDSRRARNWPPGRESSLKSVRTRSSMNGNSRVGRSNQVTGNNSSLTESSVVISPVPQAEMPIDVNIPSSLPLFSAEASSSRSSCYSVPNSSDNLPSMMPISSGELGIARLMNRDGSRRYNMHGIAEVLLALERIEQDEEVTYEQLLALETNFFLGGLNFYDQHREMRLDIDNMSYEELLALEEKMGTVSTGPSEEALSKCLRRSIYQPMPPEEGAMGCSGDANDIKCSICQEEYEAGDEVGRLGCEHGYHVVCVHQWLRLKNWCPICKASVAPSQSSSLS